MQNDLKDRIAKLKALDAKRTQGKIVSMKTSDLRLNLLTIEGKSAPKFNEVSVQLFRSDANYFAAAPTMLTIINELSDKLDIARKALEKFADLHPYESLVHSVSDIAKEALKLTDIEQEQPE